MSRQRRPREDRLSKALAVLEADTTIVKTVGANKKIENKYDGYIASFGGSIMQTGLYGTMVTFVGDEERKKVVSLLSTLHKELFGQNLPSPEEFVLEIEENYHNATYMKQLRNRLVECAVALKFAMRTMESIDNE